MAAIPNRVFYPETQLVTADPVPIPFTHPFESINALKELVSKSPFVIFAKLGPKFYSQAPFQLKNKVQDYNVFGWNRNAARKDVNEPQCFLVLGAENRDDQEVVYYAPAEYPCVGLGAGRLFRRSPTDEKIYVVSMKRFQEVTTHVVIPQESMRESQTHTSTTFVTSMPTSAIYLSEKEKQWAQRFLDFPLLSILTDRKQECKELAQQMFDQFKQDTNSDLAKKSLERICNSMVTQTLDGRLRKQYLEKAWNGVGDASVRWMA